MSWSGDFANPPGGYKGGFSAGDPATPPTLAVGAGAGTSPPTPVLAAGSLDLRGQVTWGTGTTPAAGAQVTVTFGAPLTTTPFVQITETTAVTAPLGPYVSSVSAPGFTISCQTAPSANQANTVYGVTYHVSM